MPYPDITLIWEKTGSYLKPHSASGDSFLRLEFSLIESDLTLRDMLAIAARAEKCGLVVERVLS
jgi:hypothetical protein